jgi:hypothetical protein
MINWVVARSRARDGVQWHIQARTDDQLSSFACVVLGTTNIFRGKAADGKSDVFTLSQLEPHVTFSVVGKIKYVNDWDGVK